MKTKLTINLNSNILKNAKTYAKKKNTSLSILIESYLDLLVDNHEVTPLVKSLSGVSILPKNTNHKKEYKKHLLKKYTK